MRYFFSLIAAVFLLNFFSYPVQADQVIRVSGATTVQPVVEKIIGQYTELTGQRFDIQGGGSLTGAQDAIDGTSHLGMVSRALTDEEKQSLKYVTLGMDALVFIVNQRNSLTEIDLETVISLFTGQIFNWNELTEWDREVVLVSKEIGRSTLELFEQYSGVHHRDNPSPGQNGFVSERAYEIASNLDGITLVGGVPGAVGYMSLGTTTYLKRKGMPVKILNLNGSILDNESIRKGEYPITRELNLVYLEENQEMVREFIEYCLDPRGREVILEFKYLPIN
jgi:phosphate transport system substrate-binding protein